MAETRISRLVIGVGTVIVAGLLVTTVFAFLAMRSGEIAHAKSEFSNLSLVLAEQTSSALQPADSFLQDAMRGLRHQSARPHPEQDRELHQQLKGQEASLAHVLSLFVVGPDGRPTHSSRSFPPPNINSSDRSYFKAHLGAEDRGLFISEPRRNRAEPAKWTFFLSRALRAEDGGIVRVVVGSVDLDYFETLYRDIDIPQGGRILLLRRDGTILAGYPKTDEAIGRTLADAPGFGRSRARLIGGVLESGRAQTGIANLDGVEWIVSTYPVGGYPLVVSVSVPLGAALGDWRDQAIVIGLAAVVGIGVFVFMLYLLYRQSVLREQREGALRESEERFDLAARGTADGIWDWNVVTNESFSSDRWFELLGYQRGELPEYKTTFDGLLHPDDKDRVLEAVRLHLEERLPLDVELRLQHKSGEYRWFRGRGQAVWDDDGAPLRMAGSITDITERKRAEAALRESEERVSAIVDNLPGGVYTRVVDADGNFSYPYISPGFQRIFGIDPEAAMANPQVMFDAVHPEDRDRVREARIGSVNSLETYDCEQRLVGASGAVKWCRTIARPRPLDGGGAVWVGIAIDLTEQKRAEAALRESEEKLNAFFNNSPVGMAMYDREIRYTKINRQLAWQSGLSVDEHVGKSLGEIKPDVAEALEKTYQRVFETEQALSIEIEGELPSEPGVTRWWWGTAFPATWDEDGASTIGVVALEVTEQKQAEAEVRELNERLERRVEERTDELRQVQQELVKKERLATLGQLAATVSHELRNPLGTIQTSVAVIDAKVRDKVAGVGRALDRVYRNVDRCDRIIQEMLDFTRAPQVALAPVNIDTWLAGVLDDLGAPEGMEIHRQFDAGDARVAIDGERLRRAVINVHDNACQAMTGAAADMAATAERVLSVATTASGGRLEISFSDTGSGMPADVLENAFEPLFSTKAFGVGLGLPTVKQIMETHSGGVEIESVEGRGTRVVLWLPTETVDDKRKSG